MALLDAATGNSITVDWGAIAGTYTLTVVETETATGCNTTNTLAVTVNAEPVANPITGTSPICGGSLDETYAVTNNNAGHTYAWSISGGGTLDATTGNSITVDWGTTAGTYTLTVVETETATGCATTNTLAVTIITPSTATATVTTTASVCTSPTEANPNDEGQEDLDALVTAGDLTGSWSIVSGNTGNTAAITGTMAGSDVEFDAGTETGPFVVRYTLSATAPCVDITYDVTITRTACVVCEPEVGIIRSN